MELGDLLYGYIRSYVPVLGIMVGLLMLGWGTMVAIRRKQGVAGHNIMQPD